MGDDRTELTDHERGWAQWFMTTGSHRKRKRRFVKLNDRERDVLKRFVDEHIVYSDEHLRLLRHSIHSHLGDAFGNKVARKVRSVARSKS